MVQNEPNDTITGAAPHPRCQHLLPRIKSLIITPQIRELGGSTEHGNIQTFCLQNKKRRTLTCLEIRNSRLCVSLFKIRLLTWGRSGKQHRLPEPLQGSRPGVMPTGAVAPLQGNPFRGQPAHPISGAWKRTGWPWISIPNRQQRGTVRRHWGPAASPRTMLVARWVTPPYGCYRRYLAGKSSTRKAHSSGLSPMQLAEQAKNTLRTFLLPSSLPSKLLPGCLSGRIAYTSVMKKSRNDGFWKPKGSPGHIKHHRYWKARK